MADFEYIIWPLKKGETLSNHDWWPFPTHKFLGSKFVSECVLYKRREHGFTAVMLWNEALRQDPAGTLPASDAELATLAKYSNLDEWCSCKDYVLGEWVDVHIVDENGDQVEARLGHPDLLQGIVEGMFKRKRGRDGAREAARSAVRKSRIRKKMADIKTPKHIIESEQVIQQLADYFEHSELYITPDNLRAALADCIGYTGEVMSLSAHRGK